MLCLFFPSFTTSKSQSYLPLAFSLPPISHHTVGVFGFKALQWGLVYGLQPLPFSVLPPASDVAAEKMFHLILRSVHPALAKSKRCAFMCVSGTFRSKTSELLDTSTSPAWCWWGRGKPQLKL